MAFGNDSFMEFMGYRNMIVEERINECLSAARRGESSISIDRGDLNEEEIEYLKREVSKRVGR